MAAIPTITPLPNPALSTDPEDVFNSKTDATLLAQQAMVPQLNTAIGGINSAVTQVHDDAVYAGQAADRAEAVDTNVGAQVAAAAAYANNAAASAAAAESAQGSIGNLAFMKAAFLSM